MLILLILLIALIIISRLIRNKKGFKYAQIDKDSIAPIDLTHKGLVAGDRLVIFGGYDYQPKYLGDNQNYIGQIMKFIPGQEGRKTAPVLKMDKPIQFDSLVGDYLVLETRYVGQDWNQYGPVHVELCDFEPDSIEYKLRRKGMWIESHASYEFEDRYNKIENERNKTTLPNTRS